MALPTTSVTTGSWLRNLQEIHLCFKKNFYSLCSSTNTQKRNKTKRLVNSTVRPKVTSHVGNEISKKAALHQLRKNIHQRQIVKSKLLFHNIWSDKNYKVHFNSFSTKRNSNYYCNLIFQKVIEFSIFCNLKEKVIE